MNDNDFGKIVRLSEAASPFRLRVLENETQSPLVGENGRAMNDLLKVSRIVAACSIAALMVACSQDDAPSVVEAVARVKTSTVPPEREGGRSLYAANCAGCHGAFGEGSELGPPMLHPIQARMHADVAFKRAIQGGVRPHHYRFGAMPPIDELDTKDIDAVVAYVRWMQKAAGLR